LVLDDSLHYAEQGDLIFTRTSTVQLKSFEPGGLICTIWIKIGYDLGYDSLLNTVSLLIKRLKAIPFRPCFLLCVGRPLMNLCRRWVNN